MASLFTKRVFSDCRLLDAGAGIGSLTHAFVERWKSGQIVAPRLEVQAFEIDDRLRHRLARTAETLWKGDNIQVQLTDGDFIEKATLALLGFGDKRLSFSHAILNPPYKKIATASRHRQYLRRAGIETVNLYSGFVALAIRLLKPGGELVAIIPRSFCNGPYYKPFRKLILTETAIRHIHLFDSRTSAFKDDAVLQENVIILLEKGGNQGFVTISSSEDETFVPFTAQNIPFTSVVADEDDEMFIHIPTTAEQTDTRRSNRLPETLDSLGIEVSTGPIVDFRVKEYLRGDLVAGSVPLIYPSHFLAQKSVWPRNDHKKPNALMVSPATQRSIFPSGCYTVVRRFSSKEERRRIVANIVLPEDFQFSPLGFENHLNVFHCQKGGLNERIARGLAVFLNSTLVDNYFRRFNGHTQVNATDLRNMRYPTREQLLTLGEWSNLNENATQSELDDEVLRLL